MDSSSHAEDKRSSTKACRTATTAAAAPSVPRNAAQRNRSKSGADAGALWPACATIRRPSGAPPPAPMPALAEAHGAALRDYGGEGPPVLFVPSLINPPNVLDMGDRSLLRWLRGRGRRVLLLDWGWPGDGPAGPVGRRPCRADPAAADGASSASRSTWSAIASAARWRSPPPGPARARSVATIAAPWHFNGFPDEARADLARLWADAQPTVAALGLLPMEVLQCAFWSLDPARTVAKFEAFAGARGRRGARPSSCSRIGPMTARPSPRPRRARCSRACSPRDVSGTGRMAGRRRDRRSRGARLPLAQHRLDHRPDRPRRHRAARRRAARSRARPCRHGRRLAARRRCFGSRWPAGFPALQQAARGARDRTLPRRKLRTREDSGARHDRRRHHRRQAHPGRRPSSAPSPPPPPTSSAGSRSRRRSPRPASRPRTSPK